MMAVSYWSFILVQMALRPVQGAKLLNQTAKTNIKAEKLLKFKQLQNLAERIFKIKFVSYRSRKASYIQAFI